MSLPPNNFWKIFETCYSQKTLQLSYYNLFLNYFEFVSAIVQKQIFSNCKTTIVNDVQSNKYTGNSIRFIVQPEQFIKNSNQLSTFVPRHSWKHNENIMNAIQTKNIVIINVSR